MLTDVARIATRDFGDLCIIDLIDEEGALYRAASAHADADQEDHLHEMDRQHRIRAPGKEPAQLAMTQGAPVVVDSLESLAEKADGAFGRIAKEFGLTSAVFAPLIAGDRAIGAINIARRLPYAPVEVHVIAELSSRIAVSIENARLYERAQRAVQIRNEFLSIAAHELRTPLTTLQLQVYSLRDLSEKGRTDWNEERFKVRLERCTYSVGRLAQLVETLLDVSRISTGRLELQVERVALVDIVREVIERFRDEARRAGCELRVSAGAPIVGSWDRSRIEQVLSNLLSNAVKYGAGKPIEIEVDERDGMAELRVVDHGIGLSAADLERIFGRFERAASSRNYGGLGLGLFITRRIVEAHGGRISARPTPSGGATFVVELPRERALLDGSTTQRVTIDADSQPDVESSAFQSADGPLAFLDEVKDYAIFMIDPAGRVLTWNEGARLIKGYTAEEIVGRSFERFFSAEDRARGKPAALLRRARLEGRVEDEGWRVRKDGTAFWADVVMTAIHDHDRHLRGFVKVTRDLTERRQTEQLMRESEERFRLLVDAVKDYALIMLDPSGRIATWNSGAGRIIGYSAGETIGQHVSILYPQELVHGGQAQRELEIAAKEGRFEEEGPRVRKGGEQFWASVIVTAIRDPITSELRGFAKVIRDLTERQVLEKEVESAEELANDLWERLRSISGG
jgi:PAS domain S-box-containing protein